MDLSCSDSKGYKCSSTLRCSVLYIKHCILLSTPRQLGNCLLEQSLMLLQIWQMIIMIKYKMLIFDFVIAVLRPSLLHYAFWQQIALSTLRKNAIFFPHCTRWQSFCIVAATVVPSYIDLEVSFYWQWLSVFLYPCRLDSVFVAGRFTSRG